MSTVNGRLAEKRRYLVLAAWREVHEFATGNDESLTDEAAALGLGEDEVKRAWDVVAEFVDNKIMSMREPILDGDPLT